MFQPQNKTSKDWNHLRSSTGGYLYQKLQYCKNDGRNAGPNVNNENAVTRETIKV